MPPEGRASSAGVNAHPLDDTVAETGPGLPDDALAPGESIADIQAEDPGEEAEARIRESLGVPPRPDR